MTKKRLLPADRKEQILSAAVIVAARKNGWSTLTREAVAAEANCVPSLLSRYFGTMAAFRRTHKREAVRLRNMSIIAQGLAAGDAHARKAPPDIRTEACNLLIGG